MDKEKLKEIGKICIPGMRLSLANKDFMSGPGTYELSGYIYAALAGVLKTEIDEVTKVNFYFNLLSDLLYLRVWLSYLLFKKYKLY